MLKLTNTQDIKNFTAGCCFFGAGGGGNADFGERMLQDALKLGKEIVIVDLNEINFEAKFVTNHS